MKILPIQKLRFAILFVFDALFLAFAGLLYKIAQKDVLSDVLPEIRMLWFLLLIISITSFQTHFLLKGTTRYFLIKALLTSYFLLILGLFLLVLYLLISDGGSVSFDGLLDLKLSDVTYFSMYILVLSIMIVALTSTIRAFSKRKLNV